MYERSRKILVFLVVFLLAATITFAVINGSSGVSGGKLYESPEHSSLIKHQRRLFSTESISAILLEAVQIWEPMHGV